MTPTLARRERLALCDLALAVGPDAPTLCEGWDVRDLVGHLLVRERDPLGAAGIVLGGLAVLTGRSMERQRRRDFAAAVDRLRSPGLSPFALPALDRAVNTLEYLVHHEDVRRAGPAWEPRRLPPADLDEVWALLERGRALLARRIAAPTVLRRSDSGAEIVLREGPGPVTVCGPVVELALHAFGRRQTREIELSGPPEAVETATPGA